MNESEMSVSFSMLSLSDCQPEDYPEPELNQIPEETPKLDDWNVIDRFSDEDLNDFLECYSHKMTVTHFLGLSHSDIWQSHYSEVIVHAFFITLPLSILTVS